MAGTGATLETKPAMRNTPHRDAKSSTLLQISCIYKLGHNWSYINLVSANGQVFRFRGALGRLYGRNRSRFCVIGLSLLSPFGTNGRFEGPAGHRVASGSCGAAWPCFFGLLLFVHGLAELTTR
jgi:hypothetical protein